MAKEKSYCLDTLIRVGRLLSSDTSLNERQILAILYQHAGDLLDSRHMVIALYNRRTDEPIYALMVHEGEAISGANDSSASTHEAIREHADASGVGTLLHWSLSEKKPLLLPNKRAFRTWNPALTLNVGSWVCAPMMVGSKVLGAVAAYHPSEEWVYDDEDLSHLQALADYAAIALENKEVNAQLKSMVEVGRELSSNIQLNEDEVLALIRAQLRPLMRTDNMYIALYDKTQPIRFGLVYENGTRLNDWMPTAGGTSRMWWIILNGQPLIHHTREAGEKWYSEVERHNAAPVIFSSYLGAPMTACGETIGVIALYHPEQEYAFTDADLDILVPLARYAGIALYNAQLYRAARSDVIAAQKVATLGTAMGAIQHRVYNTLTFIAPLVAGLRRRIDVRDETVRQILDDIEQNVNFTSTLISRLSGLSTEGGTTRIALGAIFQKIVEMASSRFRGVAFTLDLDSDLPAFIAFEAQLTEIFTNLVENACRAVYGREDARVIFSGNYDITTDQIVVRVEDNGAGIDPKVRANLFIKPMPSLSQDGIPSSGLGLWLSRLILAKMGGTIALEATNAHGTIFIITLPVQTVSSGGEL
ncbi:MAG: GAF domain-containing protein [Chloroflexota bacterium]|nr:GAF domain-containing protein [Chloroflexota bacterium]